MSRIIESKLKGLPENSVVLVIADTEEHNKVSLDILNMLVNKKRQQGGFINLNLPCSKIDELLKIKDIDRRNVHTVCCKNGYDITEYEKKAKNCSFIRSPEQLTELCSSLEKIFEFGKYEFLVLDSVSTLLIYNKQNTVLRFLHFLIEKIRLSNIRGVIVTLAEKNNKELLDELSQFCDKTIVV